MFWAGLGVGLVVGLVVGGVVLFFIMALCFAARDADDYADKLFKERNIGDNNEDN